MSNVIKFSISLEERNEQIKLFNEQREFEYCNAIIDVEDYIDRALHMVDKGFVMDEKDMEVIQMLKLKLKYLEAKYNGER